MGCVCACVCVCLCALVAAAAEAIEDDDEESVSDDDSEAPAANLADRKTLLTPALSTALTKQGYQLIGTHSGVKVCARNYGVSCFYLLNFLVVVLVVSVDQGDAARAWWLLQTHLLQYHIISVHGDDAIACVCEQVSFSVGISSLCDFQLRA